MEWDTQEKYILPLGSVGVTLIVGTMRKNRLKWFEHVVKKNNSEPMRVKLRVTLL